MPLALIVLSDKKPYPKPSLKSKSKLAPKSLRRPQEGIILNTYGKLKLLPFVIINQSGL
jgi:hypothetical protein